jgi:AcrR family transcriptional regulator
MARPVDPARRDELLADIMDAVARFGLGNLSLRALGRELGVSPRTLLYHFDSRDGVLDAIVAETSRRLAEAAAGMEGTLADVVRASWQWMTRPRQRGFVNVFYEVCALGVRDPERRGAVASSLFGAWHAELRRRGMPDAAATLLLASLHGLLLDYALTRERVRVDRGFSLLLDTFAPKGKVT